MKLVISHPTGNRNVRAILEGLYQNDMLAEFDTTIAVQPNAVWLKLLPRAVRQELMRRVYEVPADKIHAAPYLELLRIATQKLKLKTLTRHETGAASVDAIYRNLDLTVSKRLEKLIVAKNIKGVYAYEDGALETFKRAKELGLKCVYDLPIAYWETGRRIMKEDAERLPQWSKTLGGGIKDSASKLERKTLELELADVVVGPGSFVINSLPQWASGKNKIVSPFGSPLSSVNDSIISERRTDTPLRVLFVGSMGQRKGLGDLFAAIKMLGTKKIELVVMGALLAPMEFYKQELPNFTYEPGRPHHQVLQLMQSCDVFCLPSIVEGRALVMQEAMSQGLPLIITPNTGGEDLIKEGETGFLVPIKSPEKIAEKLSWCLENRSRVIEMGLKAKNLAATYTWNNYASQVVQSIKALI